MRETARGPAPTTLADPSLRTGSVPHFVLGRSLRSLSWGYAPAPIALRLSPVRAAVSACFLPPRVPKMRYLFPIVCHTQGPVLWALYPVPVYI